MVITYQETAMKTDFKETKELLALLASAGEFAEGLLDGLDAGDTAKLLEVIQRIQPGFEKVAEVIKEIRIADDEDRASLKAHLVSELDLSDDAAEQVVEILGKWVIDTTALLQLFSKSAAPQPDGGQDGELGDPV